MNARGLELSIGELAAKVAINTSRIRYYEEIELLPKPARTTGDRRMYSHADVKRLVFIKRCRDFGFSLKQTRELVSLSLSADRDCAEVGAIAGDHLGQVRSKIAELTELATTLDQFVVGCQAVCCGGPGRDCLIFDGISVPE